MKKLFLIFPLMALVGCSTQMPAGCSITEEKLATIHVGSTTRDDLLKAFGEPESNLWGNNGDWMGSWSCANGSWATASFPSGENMTELAYTLPNSSDVQYIRSDSNKPD